MTHAVGPALVRHAIPDTGLSVGLPPSYRVAAATDLGAALPPAFADEVGVRDTYTHFTATSDVRQGLRLIASDAAGTSLVLIVEQLPVATTSTSDLSTFVGGLIDGSHLTYVPASGRSYRLGSTEIVTALADNATRWGEFVVVPAGRTTVSLGLTGPRSSETSSAALRATIVTSLRTTA